MQFATANGTVTFESLWRTRDGNTVPVNEMDDEHLLNTIDFLRRSTTSEYILPFCDEPSVPHNIEVLTRELVRRTEG